MPTYKRIQNRLHKIKMEIMEIEKVIEHAEKNGKPHFASRLRMMIEKKIEKISSLSEES